MTLEEQKHLLNDEEIEIIEMLDRNVNKLADLRKWIKEDEAKQAELGTKIAEANPELYVKWQDATDRLAELRKQEKNLGVYVRAQASKNAEIALQTPWLTPRYPTVVEVLPEVALKLAAVFCPDAIVLDSKVFDKWAIKHQEVPTFANYFQVKQVPGFTILTDLTTYETEVKDEEVV